MPSPVRTMTVTAFPKTLVFITCMKYLFFNTSVFSIICTDIQLLFIYRHLRFRYKCSHSSEQSTGTRGLTKPLSKALSQANVAVSMAGVLSVRSDKTCCVENFNPGNVHNTRTHFYCFLAITEQLLY